MNTSGNLWAAVCVLLPIAALAQAPAAGTVAEKRSPISFAPYGFVVLNVFFDDGPFLSQTYPGQALPCPASGVVSGCNHGGSLVVNVRQSRLGTRIAFDDTDGWTRARLSGLVEIDFQGGFTGTTSSTFYNALVRLRKAWGEASWGGDSRFSLRFGQDDRVISPLRATSLAFSADALFNQSGLIYGRVPQLALRYELSPRDGIAASVAVSANNPQDVTFADLGASPGVAVDFGAGNRGRLPNFEARASIGWRSAGAKVVDLGVWGGWQRNRYVVPSVPPTTANPTGAPLVDADVNCNVVGGDLNLSLWILQAMGAIYLAHGYDVLGSLATQGVVAATTGSPARLVVPVQGRAVKAFGGWFQVIVNLTPVQIYGGWGGTQTPFSELTGTTLAVPGGRVQNFTWAAGAIASAGKNWRFSVEYARTTSWYYSGASANAGQLSVNSQLLF